MFVRTNRTSPWNVTVGGWDVAVPVCSGELGVLSKCNTIFWSVWTPRIKGETASKLWTGEDSVLQTACRRGYGEVAVPPPTAILNQLISTAAPTPASRSTFSPAATSVPTPRLTATSHLHIRLRLRVQWHLHNTHLFVSPPSACPPAAAHTCASHRISAHSHTSTYCSLHPHLHVCLCLRLRVSLLAYEFKLLENYTRNCR